MMNNYIEYNYIWRTSMKTKKQNLNAIALGVALAVGSMSALAAPFEPQPPINPAAEGAYLIAKGELVDSVYPTFNSNERLGLCLLESTVSLLAARTNDFGCGDEEFGLVVGTDSPLTGTAVIDRGAGKGGTTLNGELFPSRDIGTKCKVDLEDGDKVNQLSGVEVVKYDGAHGWSRKKDIFNSDAFIEIRSRAGHVNKYREVDIKDFFKQVIEGRSWEFDWGLEDIKKFRLATATSPDFYYPVQKWQELSWYRHENGGEGGLYVKKFQISPRNGAGCTIRVEATNLYNITGQFVLDAIVHVGREPIGPDPVAPAPAPAPAAAPAPGGE